MRKKSLSLMLAASMISSMFSVRVSAVAHQFDAQGLLKVHEVTVNEQGCTINPEGTNEINLDFNTGNRKFFAFEVDKSFLSREENIPHFEKGTLCNEDQYQWLGAGDLDIKTNRADDYKVAASFTYGVDKVRFDTIRQQRGEQWDCHLDNDRTVRPLILVFRLRKGVTDARIRGELVIDAGFSTVLQKIPFAGTVGTGTDGWDGNEVQGERRDYGLEDIYINTLLPVKADGVTPHLSNFLVGNRKLKWTRKIFEPGPRPVQPKVHSVDVQELVRRGS